MTSLCSLLVSHLPCTSVCSTTWKLSKCHHLGNFMKISLCRYVWLSHWQSWLKAVDLQPLSLGWAEKSNPLKMTCAFLVTNPHPEALKARISLVHKRHSYHSENSKGFKSSLPGTGDKDQILVFYCTLLVLSSCLQWPVFILQPHSGSLFVLALVFILLGFINCSCCWVESARLA